MNQKDDHPADKRLITGASGTGKSTLAEKLMRSEDARWKFVYDPEGEFAARFEHETVNAAGMDDAVIKGGWIVYDPSDDFPEDYGMGTPAKPGGFAFFCDYVLAFSKVAAGRKMVYADELDIRAPGSIYPWSLCALMQTGRKRQVDCVFVSGQPNSLHNRVRIQFTAVYTFLLTDAAALKYLVENGIPEQTIRDLGEHGWYYRHLRTGVTDSNVKKALQSPIDELALPAKG